MMKILTLNTHSLQESYYPEKLEWFVQFVLREQPDIIALQEVNQTAGARRIRADRLYGMVSVPGAETPVREDNHALAVASALRRSGLEYHWAWIGFKIGYDKYDEGMAILSRQPMAGVESHLLSSCDDYRNWRTRRVLGFRPVYSTDWFYTVHMGWWQDAEEPFRAQWERMEAAVQEKKKHGAVWLMGDFNGPAEVRGESYDCVKHAGWYDTYLLAEDHDDGITVEGAIDGWRDEVADKNVSGMRIDQIWCSEKTKIRSSRVVLSGKRDPVVSDHYGILIETGEQ